MFVMLASCVDVDDEDHDGGECEVIKPPGVQFAIQTVAFGSVPPWRRRDTGEQHVQKPFQETVDAESHGEPELRRRGC